MATERVRKLLELAEQLDPRERVELADELLHSVDASDEDTDEDDGGPLHPAWKRELQERIDDVDRGRAEVVSWTDVKASLRKAIASARRRG